MTPFAVSLRRAHIASRTTRWTLIVLMLILAVPVLAAEPKFPVLIGRVVDDAHVLNSSTVGELTLMLSEHERTTGQQVVVVTLPSLQGYTIEDFGYQLGRHWGIGQKGTNNGALLIVVPKEHKVRIEVGYGLEGTLTDATSRTIIENDIVPNFRRGDFNAGVLAGTTSIVQVLGGNPLSPKAQAPPQYPHLIKGAPWQGLVSLAIFGLFFFGGFGFFIVMWFLHRNDPYDPMTYGGGRGYSGGSWGGGGSSDGGGGFSGGGGSFGGGGASGSW